MTDVHSRNLRSALRASDVRQYADPGEGEFDGPECPECHGEMVGIEDSDGDSVYTIWSCPNEKHCMLCAELLHCQPCPCCGELVCSDCKTFCEKWDHGTL
jgi:hypothetical protein